MQTNVEPYKTWTCNFFFFKGKRAGYDVYLEQPERLVENKLWIIKANEGEYFNNYSTMSSDRENLKLD